ncbi:uncharacterized protein ISCGN_018272 [Ixodes scapularis]
MERNKRSRSSGKHCAVFGCTNNSRKRNLERTSTANGVELKFHRFPVDKDEKRKWLSAVNRANFTPTTNSRVCSAHFVGGTKTDENSVPQLDLGYARKVVFGRRRLARDASDQVPTTKKKKLPSKATNSASAVHSVQSTDNTDLGAALRQPVSEHMSTHTVQSTDDTDLCAVSWQPASEHVTIQSTDDTDLGATSWQPASEHVAMFSMHDIELGTMPWLPVSEHTAHPTQFTDDTDLGATTWLPAFEHVTTQPTDDTDLGAVSWQPASEHMTMFSMLAADDTELGATPWLPMSEHVTTHSTQSTDDTDLGATTWLPASEHVDSERRRMAPHVCHQGVQWEDPCLSDHLYTTFAAPSVPTVPHGTYSLEERDILFYTGVQADVFMELVKVVPQFASSNFVMPVEQQLLLTLMKLRLGLVYGDLSRRDCFHLAVLFYYTAALLLLH